jgi:hypothetical protein
MRTRGNYTQKKGPTIHQQVDILFTVTQYRIWRKQIATIFRLKRHSVYKCQGGSSFNIVYATDLQYKEIFDRHKRRKIRGYRVGRFK